MALNFSTARALSLLLAICVVYFYATFYVYGHIVVASLLVLVLSVFSIIMHRSFALSLPRNAKLLALSFFMMLLSGIPASLIDHSYRYSLSNLDVLSRYALFALFLIFLFKSKIKLRADALLLGVALGSIGGFVYAFCQYYFLGYSRACGGIDIFAFGCMVGFLNVVSLFAALYFSRGKLFLKIIFLICALLDMMSCFYNGSRSFIFSMIIIDCLILTYYFFSTANKCETIVILFLLLLAFFVAFKFGNLGQRLAYTKSEMIGIANNDFDSSSGLRVLIYKNHLKRFLYSPLFGLDVYSTKMHVDEIFPQDDKDMQRVENIDHIEEKRRLGKGHNDFVTSMSFRGLVGLFSFIFMLYAIYRMGFDYFRDTTIEVQKIGLLLLFVISYFTIASLGVDVFNSMKESIMICFSISIISYVGFLARTQKSL